MDDRYGLDRLDRWLNAQQSTRRLLLTGLDGVPLAALLSALAWRGLAYDTGAGAPSPLGLVAVAIVLAIPGGLLISGFRAWTTRHFQGQRDEAGPRHSWPRYSWRTWTFLALIAVDPICEYLYVSSDHLPRMPLWMSMLPVAAAAVMLYWETRYRKRGAKARPPQQGLTGG